MSVQPVKYTEKDVVPVQPGDVIPAGDWIIFLPNKVFTHARLPHEWHDTGDAIAYAPAPILDLPQEPKEIPFGEAMERIRDGEEFLWELDDRREVVGQDLRVLCFMRSPSNYPINNLGELGDGRFYEIPWPSTPEPKTTGLNWWEAIKAVRGTDKWARHKNAPMDSSKLLYARWDGNVLRDARGELFHFNYDDVTSEWEIVE